MKKLFTLRKFVTLFFVFELISVFSARASFELRSYYYSCQCDPCQPHYLYRYNPYYHRYYYYPGHNRVYYYVIPSISILKSDIHYNGYRKSECIKGCGNDYYYKLIFDENSNNPKVSKYAFSISREKEDIGCNWTIYIRYHKDMYAFLNLLDNVLGYKRCKNIIEGSKEFFIGSDRVYMYPFCCRLVKNHEIAEFERKHKNITYF